MDCKEIYIGSRIQAYIKSKNISQMYIANETGIPYRRLSRMLCGVSVLSAEEFYEICKCLGMDMGKFVGSTGDGC